MSDDDNYKRSRSQSETRLIFTLAGIIFGLAIILAAPGVPIIFIIVMLTYERRRVRVKAWAAWLAGTLLAGLAFAGFSITTWLYWSSSLFAKAWAPKLPDGLWADSSGWAGWIGSHTTASWTSVIWTQLWFGGPIGIAIAMIIMVTVRQNARRLRGRIEGPEHSNVRPVGILDRRRRDIERRNVAAGMYTTAGEEN